MTKHERKLLPPISVAQWAGALSRWDVIAALLVLGLLVFLAEASRDLLAPLSELQAQPVSLGPQRLPEYAARTTLRLFAALGISILFTLTYATLAAKSRRAELLLLPLLDILQSVPILGFISVTVVFFMSLAPGRILGAELAAVFAIFTSQAWNMAFSFYQSLRTVPVELIEASRVFRLSGWMHFWRVEVPFAMPQLIWNMMMSMSGAWFFVVASEAITVGNTTVLLPGMGSYIAVAIAQKSLAAVGWAIATMLVVIMIYDVMFFRPLVAWADKFRFQQQASVAPEKSFVLDALRRSRAVATLSDTAAGLFQRALYWIPSGRRVRAAPQRKQSRVIDWLWAGALGLASALAIGEIALFGIQGLAPAELRKVMLLACATLIRVVVLIAIASLIWVPIGIWVGTRAWARRLIQPVAQFLAAFPANLLFPIVVSAIVVLALDPNVWLSPLMILGTQWYILFNVIAGAAAIPAELHDCCANLGVRGWLWWRTTALPAVFPYYVTGAITASGGSWNASIVAEVASWGDQRLEAFGIGAYIAAATAAGDFHRIVLGIAVMSLFVVAINRAFWRPLYRYAERKYRLE
jgi:NitT/TauT family transport system permease protein